MIVPATVGQEVVFDHGYNGCEGDAGSIYEEDRRATSQSEAQTEAAIG